MVQARWGHINQDYSLLTKIQSILLDAHFVLEHGGRNRAGCFFNFNGTAGVWRRKAIESAGGWQHDTLTEDLDLSYRGAARRMAVRLPPGRGLTGRSARRDELVQVAAAPLGQGVDSDVPEADAPDPSFEAAPRVKAEAFFHLSANFNYLLMSVLSVLMFPRCGCATTWAGTEMLLIDVPLFAATVVRVQLLHRVAARAVRRTGGSA